MKTLLLPVLLFLVACKNKQSELPSSASKSETAKPVLSPVEVKRLSGLPLRCMDHEYPNKLNQTLAGKTEIAEPSALHPAFYGCFDWHSSVHGHWMLVHLLKKFPTLENADTILQKLTKNITKENILKEVEYFNRKTEKSYERTYGWAWLLKLAEELHTWNTPVARELETNLQPLTNLIVERYMNFLPKLLYPVRGGEHPNTAFGLAFALDYAHAVNHTALRELILKKSREFYGADKDCPLRWEPGGFDFLSPCLEEADLMRRVLPRKEYRSWLEEFLPGLKKKKFKLAPGKVGDRTDGKLVHLDGVNFSRAWCLLGIAETLPEYSHLENTAYEHIRFSLPGIVDGSYEGEHWLASFAVYSLSLIK